MPEFTLSIALGNAAMESAEDVAIALRGVADLLQREQTTTGIIRDENGNTVGHWRTSGLTA